MNKAKLRRLAEGRRPDGTGAENAPEIAQNAAGNAPEIAQNAARIAQDAPEGAGRASERPAATDAPRAIPARLRSEWTIGEPGISLGELYMELIGAADFERTQRSPGEVCRVAYTRAKVALRVWRDMQEREREGR